MLSIIRPALTPCSVSCDVWCVCDIMWCGIYAMLMTVITDLIRVIRNQLRCPVSTSAPPPVYTATVGVLFAIIREPKHSWGDHTMTCHTRNSDGITLSPWWVVSGQRSIIALPHESLNIAWYCQARALLQPQSELRSFFHLPPLNAPTTWHDSLSSPFG